MNDAFYRSIELTVNAHGTQAVRDLEARVQDLNAQIAKYQQQLQSGATSTADAQKQFEKLSAELATATEAAAAANRVLGGLPAQLDDTARSAKGAALAALELSRAFEDFATGGVLGALNNVPGAVRGVGMAAGLAAPQVAALEVAASMAATTGYILYKNWGSLMGALGTGKIRSETEELEELAKQIKRTAEEEEKYQKLKERAKHADAQSKDPDGVKKFKDDVDKAIANGPVADIDKGLDKVFGGRIRAMADTTPGAKEAADRLAAAKKMLAREQAEPLSVRGTKSETLIDAEQEAAAAQKEMSRLYAEARTRFRADLGSKPDTVKELAKAASANPGDFGRGGRDFAKALREADPKYKAKQEQNERVREAEEEAADQLRESAHREQVEKEKAEREVKAERDRRTTVDAARVGPGVDDALQKSMYDAIKAGQAPEAAIHAQRPGLFATLRGRGVNEDVVSDVAQKILEKASESALNLINEGDKPKLDKKAEAAAKKAEGEAETAKNKADTEQRKVATERGRKVGEVDQAFTDRAVAMMAQNDLARVQGAPMAKSRQQEQNFRATGQAYSVPQEVLNRRIEAMIANDLRAGRKDPGLAPDIRQRAATTYDTMRTEAAARTPAPDVSGVADAVGGRQAAAAAQQAQVSAALIDVLAGLNAKISQLEQTQQQNLFKINGMARNQRRGTTVFPTNQLPF